MNIRYLIYFLTICSLSSLLNAAELPYSHRADNAIKRVQPKLLVQLKQLGMDYGSPIFIRIFKESSELELWVKKDSQFELFNTYSICTFSGKLGPKLKVGDNQSPEGFYFVNASRLNPWSSYHLSFNVGYPNKYDRIHKRTGSALMVHGNCVSIGCYAMTDDLIEEIYTLAQAALSNGQKFFRVHIFPFRMTDNRMKISQNDRWYSFWENLKQGYDIFEMNRIPPSVEVQNKVYVFNAPAQ